MPALLAISFISSCLLAVSVVKNAKAKLDKERIKDEKSN